MTKKNNLYIILFGFFLTNALLAELIGVKIFSLESILGLQPLSLSIFGIDNLSLNLSAGVILWPIVFIVSDIINEYFGPKTVMKISYITASLICFAFLVVYTATKLPPADFWIKLNQKDNIGNDFNINYAYSLLFGQGLGIIIGSLIAFLVGQLIDAVVFQKIKKLTKNKFIWLRATGSTIVSQLIDSFVVLTIAFYVFGNWSFHLVLAVGIINFIYKITISLVMIPVLYGLHFIIDSYISNETTHPTNKLSDNE